MRFSYYGQPPMNYAPAPEMGYYGGPPYGYYGYDATGQMGYPGYGPPEPVGYYAEETPLGYYGHPYAGDPYAHMNGYAGYAPQGYGQVGDDYGNPYGNPYGAEADAAYGDPYGDPYGNPWGTPYGDEPQGMGEEFSDDINDYGEQEMSGYVRDVPPSFNAGCPMPTNVGMGAADTLEGYVRPSDVSPTCRDFAPASKSTATLPETLKPLW